MNLRASNANGFISNKKIKENAFSQTKFLLEKCLRCLLPMEKADYCFPKEKEKQMLAKLIDNDMVVFRYCDKDGNIADGKYPINPNGSHFMTLRAYATRKETFLV